MIIYFYRLIEPDFGIHVFEDGFEIALIWFNFLVDWRE